MAPDVIWIPFLSITLGMGAIFAVIITLHRAKMRELDQRHKERMAAIEKGLDPSFGSALEATEGRRTTSMSAEERLPPRYLLRGLLWVGVGLAYGLSAGGGRFNWVSLPGWIAAAIGGAYVVYYVMEGRRAPPPPASPPERPPVNDRGP